MGITRILNKQGAQDMDITAALKEIRQHRNRLTRQQIRTIKGQVLSGDIDGAMRGLHKLTGGEGNGANTK